MRHNLQFSIFKDIQDQKEIQNTSPFYIDTLHDCFANVTMTKAELEKSIQNLSLHPLILYDINFAKFLMISSAMKKKKPFSRTLSPVYSPMIHLSLSNFIKRVGIRDIEIVTKHSLKFSKSLQTSFCEPKPPKPSPELFVSNNNTKSYENLVISLSSKINEIEWTEIIFTATKNGLKLNPQNPIFMNSLLRLLPHFFHNEEKEKEEVKKRGIFIDLPQIDSFWSAFFIDFICQYDIKNESCYELLSRLSPSVLLSIAKEEDIAFQSFKNIILQKKTFNSFDFLSEVPLIMNDRISSIYFNPEEDLLLIQGKSGKTYRYIVKDHRLMSTKFCLLNYSLNFILRKFGDTRERGILLPAIQSLLLPDQKSDIFISETSCIPFSKIKRNEMRFETKKENILWKSLLAERLGALSALQILLKGDFDLNTALISEKSVFFAFEDIILKCEDDDNEMVRLPLFIDKTMINGPFKNGIIATFLCFSFYKDELLHFLGPEIDSEKVEKKLSEFSIPDSSAEIVNNNIDKLIEFSLEDKMFSSVPWF